MTRAPEQSIVDQLEVAGYSEKTIISYLEARVAKEWESTADFAECGQGEKMVFGVCRKVDGAGDGGGAATASAPKPEQKKEDKKKEVEKTDQEKELEAAAKAQGSSPTNNRKVVINGKSYGWAIQGGKPIMVEWGSVAGEKKVGTGEKPKKGRSGSRSGSTRGAGGGGGNIESLSQRAKDAWAAVPKEGRTPENAARYATAIATAQAADKALREAERAATPQPRGRRAGG